MRLVSIAVTLLLLSTFPADLDSQPMRFWVAGTGGNCGWCVWIAAEGEITEQSAAAFEALEYHGTPEVVLNSSGGSLIGGLLLGEAIRRRGLSTSVGATVKEGNYWDRDRGRGECLSSCALAFLGGTSRRAGTHEIGVHQYYFPGALDRPAARIFSALDLSEQQVINAIIIEYVHRMGADARFASTAASTPPSEMYYFTDAELDEFKVTTRPTEYLPWMIEPYRGGIVARSRLERGTFAISVFCRQDGVPRMLISGDSRHDDRDRLAAAINSLRAIAIFGVNVPPSSVSIVTVDGHSAIEIPIPELDGRSLGDVVISADAPMVSLAYFWYNPPTTMAAVTIEIALKNCHH